jgi:hypothetical protein
MQKFNGEKFFDKLYEDEDFCKLLGKIMLSSNKLEVQLIKYIENNNIKKNMLNSTMGTLINVIENAGLLSKMIPILKGIVIKRNYFTHNIYLLLSDIIDDKYLLNNKDSENFIKKNLFEMTLEEKEYFSDEDTHVFIVRAWDLVNDLNGITDIIEKYNNKK